MHVERARTFLRFANFSSRQTLRFLPLDVAARLRPLRFRHGAPPCERLPHGVLSGRNFSPTAIVWLFRIDTVLSLVPSSSAHGIDSEAMRLEKRTIIDVCERP